MNTTCFDIVLNVVAGYEKLSAVGGVVMWWWKLW